MTLSYSNHGGGCCGAKHIYDFRHGDHANPRDNGLEDARQLIRTLSDNREDTNRAKLQEIILSDLQTRNRPRLLETMARVGFVYTDSWTGNHGTPVHRFSRARNRLRLSQASLYRTWYQTYGGMVAGTNLGGNLPVFDETTPRE